MAPERHDDRTVGGDADFSLTALVRQWVKTSEALDRRGRPAGDTSPPRPRWTPPEVTSPAVPLPALPRRHRRSTAPSPGQSTRRLAVLIDVETTSSARADGLFAVLADHGQVSVCRAYADWASPGARDWWSAPLRQHGIQPHHHFDHDHDQRSLVALTIDAVDPARDTAVDLIALVGDLTSLQPLVVRLNAAGVKVLAFGTTATPVDVLALCHEFVDLTTLESACDLGKHRA
ncbi:NYN domain-containing protein [Nocardioides sp. B-3]|uniref:NYN domain-containing protein n=1 Tax=Nocardioides sp. B-3 TaxID=2895565 RepID=UPI002152044D|nr:NYN domain-containing protein [Nocardioides sp. B-3]UUZ61492.1 NYN domain-containing protein [Nocardioides sp. B-3]